MGRYDLLQDFMPYCSKSIFSQALVNMSVIILPNAKKSTRLLASLEMPFALQCGHATRLAFCFSLLTLPVCALKVASCLLKVPSGSLSFLSQGDFWTLCRILGTFATHPFTAVPAPPGLVPRRWCKAATRGCAWDPAEGKAGLKGHRNFHVNSWVSTDSAEQG